MVKNLMANIIFTGIMVVLAGSYSAQCSLTITDIQNSSPISCNGSCNGELTVTFTGEAGNTSFQWLDSNNNDLNTNSSVITGLCAGNYSVFITDDNNCTSDTSFILVDPAVITSNITRTNTPCGSTIGELDVTGGGGCGGPYQYSLNGDLFQASGTFPGLGVSFDTITVQDTCGCTQDFTDYVTSTDGPTLIPTLVNPTCNGDNNGSISIFAVGVPSFTYSIDGGTIFSATSIYPNLTPGGYLIATQDGVGCQTLEYSTIVEPDIISLTPILINETCVGNNGSINLQGAGGTGSLQYSIDNGVSFQAPLIYNGLVGATYNYIVKDDNNCQNSGIAILTSGGGPTITSSSFLNPVCTNNCNGVISVSAIGNSPITYELNAIVKSIGEFQNLCPDSHSVIITDVDGCISTPDFTLLAPIPPKADFTVSDTVGFAPLTVDFTNSSTGASSYFWDFGDASSTSTLSDPQFEYINDGSYTVIMIATELLCTDTAYRQININKPTGISMPNVFTPNNDGINDVFRPIGSGAEEIQGKIFNRFGEMIYEWWGTNGYWDGYSRPTGQLVPAGSYFYIVTTTDTSGETFELSGSVQLMR